jgi:hypothetical protein
VLGHFFLPRRQHQHGVDGHGTEDFELTPVRGTLAKSMNALGALLGLVGKQGEGLEVAVHLFTELDEGL